MVKALFSKMERFLIRKNKRFVIQTDSSDRYTSSDNTAGDCTHEGLIEPQDQRFSMLIEDTRIPSAVIDEPPDI